MIELTGVTKRYGDLAAVDGFTLTLPDSGIYCLLGRNGAGKTTLMKLVAGHIGATAGRIEVDGRRVTPARMPESVTYIEGGGQQFNMRVGDLIDAAAGLQPDFDAAFAHDMVGRFDLAPGKRFRKLSLGMKAMVTTIIALANNSKTILMDELTLGFDAVMRAQFNTLLLESFEAHPRLIVVSTHLIDEIAKVAQRLVVIDHGRLLLEAGIEDIDELAYTLSGPVDAVRPLLAGLNCIGQTVMGSVMAAHVYDRRITPPPGVAVTNMDLQDFFVNLVEPGSTWVGGNHE